MSAIFVAAGDFYMWRRTSGSGESAYVTVRDRDHRARQHAL